MPKVKFILSPIGAFNLAYAVGMEAELSDSQAETLIEAGYAELVETPEKVVAEKPEVKAVETPEKFEVETPEKKSRKK